MLEYALLLAVIISALLIMQTFVKRGFQGRLKADADRMGDQFSASGTTRYEDRSMTTAQDIVEEVATTDDADTGIGAFVPATVALEGTVDKGVYSLNKREGGDSTTEIKQQTDSAKLEKVRWSEFQADEFDDFTDPY